MKITRAHFASPVYMPWGFGTKGYVRQYDKENQLEPVITQHERGVLLTHPKDPNTQVLVPIANISALHFDVTPEKPKPEVKK